MVSSHHNTVCSHIDAVFLCRTENSGKHASRRDFVFLPPKGSPEDKKLTPCACTASSLN